MTTAATKAAAASIRLKNGAVEAGKNRGGGAGNSPPSTPPLCAHSNSIASNSTNYQFYYYQPILSSSPPGSNMSSAMSTSSNSSSSSSVSSLASSSNGYFSSMRKQQRQQQQQRRSPQQQQQKESGSYFNSIQQPGSGVKRNGSSVGSTQKHRDGVQRFPQNHHQPIRQSPASILGGGLSISPTTNSSVGNSTIRKPRSKHSSPLLCVGSGMISPTHPLIPTALTHFAGSKCFDAPAPTALPKPPEHWTGAKSAEKVSSSAGTGLQCVLSAAAARPHHIHHQNHHHAVAHESRSYGGHIVKSSKRNLLDEFDTHNLKLLLNVQS